MAQQFNLTAQINLQSPKNVGRVVSDIQRQLKGSGLNTVNIKVKADPRTMAQTNRQLQNVGKSSRAAAKDINTLNRNLQEATRRFSVITIATGTLLSLVTGFKNATKAAIEFERELLKISQVTGKSVQQLQGLTKEVTRLSTSFGVSSADLLNVSRTLAQAGFNAEKTRKALDILAKTTLAATFDNIQDTTEGAIALLRQFGAEAKRSGGDVAFLEKSLDAINAVSKKFAVESGDLITVIRRVGGVFSAAGGSINELIALFTSVRATTRESAETIATGLRTIFTRIQRTDTIQQLKALNIELQDSQGRFVGAFEAVKRLSEGLSALDPRDFRFSQIVEELGGFRQIGKVIPLIQQFATAQQALTVAQNASGSTAKDAAIAQQGLGNQIAKVREEFTALIRKFTDSGPFNSIATGALKIASAMIKVAEAVEPLLPLLTTMFGLKLGRSLAPGLGRLAGIGRSGAGGGAGFSKFARGGMVPGSGNRDTVPAMLTPGEFVIKKSSVKKLGADTLAQMNNNRYAAGGIAKQKSVGIAVPDIINPSLEPKTGSVDVNVDEVLSKKVGFGELASKSIKDIYGISAGIKGKKRQNLEAKGKKSITALRDIAKKEFGFSSRSFSTVAEGVGTDEKKEFDTIITEESKKLLSNSVERFGRVAGVGLSGNEVQFSPEYAVSQAQRGNIFEDIITAFNGQPLQGEASEQNRPFDFTNGIKTNKLFEALASIKYIDAKISGGANIAAGEFKKKTTGQLAFELSKSPLLTAGRKFASGGGVGGSDTVPAMLTPGEFVFNKSAAKSIGYDNLKIMNEQGVKGYAAGGVVSTGRSFYGNGPPISSTGSAADILKAAEDEIDARKKNTDEMTKNTGEEKKNTNESKKDTQSLKKHSDIVSKSKDKISQFASKIQSGAASVQRIASSAQNFVFLGASIGAVTSQMSSLDDTTKQAVNETAGFAAGIVGIGATVVDVFSSIVTSAASQALSSETVVRGNVEHAISSKGVVASNKQQAASGGKLGSIFGGVAVGVLVAMTALKFFSAKSKATADKIEKGIDEALAGVAEGRSADAAALTRSAAEEIKQRKRSAAQFSTGAIATAGTFALAGAAIGTIVPGVGNAVGALVGGLVGAAVGAGAALLGVELGAYGEIEAKKAQINAIYKSIDGIISLTASIYEFETALAAVDSAAGLSDKDRLERRNLALDNAPGLSFSSVTAQSNEARAQLGALAQSRGKSFQALTEQDFEDDEDAAQQFKFATDLMEKSAKAAEVRFKATSKTFQLAMQTANPSKTFEELRAEGGEYEKALNAQIESIKLMTGIQIAAAEQQLRELKATGANQKAIDEQRKSVNSLKKSQEDLIKNTLDGAEAAQKVANAQYEAARRTREASIALAKSLIESGQFFDGLNKQLQALQGEALAIDNFNAALDGAVFKFKEINIDEIDNLTNVRDLNTFAKQLGDAAKGAGPEAQKYVDQLTANAAAFKRAQEGGLLGLELGLSKDAGAAQTEKILKDLGFSADTLGGGELGQKIFEEMQSQLTKALEDGVVDATELEAILGPAEKANAQAVDAAKKLVEIRQQEITNLQANLAAQEKLRQKEIEIREAQIDVIRKGVGRTEKAQEILAKSIDPRAEFTPQRGVETRLQNINAQNRLDTLGIGLQAGDIGGVTQARRNAQQRQEQIRKEIEAGGLTTEQTKALIEEQDRLAKIINTTGDELKRLSDRSSEAADIQGAMEQNLRAIEKERKAREQVTGVIEDFVVGGVEARRGLVEAATGVRQAFASGTLQMQTPEQRKATVGLLDRLSDTKLLGGMTGRQIKQELVFRDAVRLGLDPELAKAIALGTSTEEKLIQANENLAKKMEQLTVATLLASQGLGNPFASAALATGGMVQYRAGGGSIFKPRGTDTVPAMLSPGEFVIRKSAVDSIGADTLAAINDGNYLHAGGKPKHDVPTITRPNPVDGRINEIINPDFVHLHPTGQNIMDEYKPMTKKAMLEKFGPTIFEPGVPESQTDPNSLIRPDEFYTSGPFKGMPKSVPKNAILDDRVYPAFASYEVEDPGKRFRDTPQRDNQTPLPAHPDLQTDTRKAISADAAAERIANEGLENLLDLPKAAGYTLIDGRYHKDYDRLHFDEELMTQMPAFPVPGVNPANYAGLDRHEMGQSKGMRNLDILDAERRAGVPADKSQLALGIDKYGGRGSAASQFIMDGVLPELDRTEIIEDENFTRVTRTEGGKSKVKVVGKPLGKTPAEIEAEKQAEKQAEKEAQQKAERAKFSDDIAARIQGSDDPPTASSTPDTRSTTSKVDKANEAAKKAKQASEESAKKQKEAASNIADIAGLEDPEEIKKNGQAILAGQTDMTNAQNESRKLLAQQKAAEQDAALAYAEANNMSYAQAQQELSAAQISADAARTAASLIASSGVGIDVSEASYGDSSVPSSRDQTATASAATDAAASFKDYIEGVRAGESLRPDDAQVADSMDPTAFPDPTGTIVSPGEERIKFTESRDPKDYSTSDPQHEDILAKNKAEFEARKDAKKQRARELRKRIAQLRRYGQIGGVTVDPAASFGIDAPMHRGFQPLFGYNMSRSEAAAIARKEMEEESEAGFQAGVAAGAAAAGVQEERSLRQKSRDRAFGRRGITGTSSSRFKARVGGRFRQEDQVALNSMSNAEKKRRYERILRMQGPVIAARYAQTIGYEPPSSSFSRRGRSQQSGASTTDQLLQQLLQQMLRQSGGNRGGITPRRTQYNAAGGSAGGADVIPAMLTPGEFVMSAGAVRQHGVGAMRALNRGQVPGFNRGGMVGGVAYRSNGSPNAEVASRSAFAIDTEGLDLFQETFDKTVQGVADSLKGVSEKLGHFEMSHTFSGEVGLNVTGVDIDPKIIADQFTAAFTDMVKVEIEKAINNPELRPPG